MKRFLHCLTALFLIAGISAAGAAPSAVPDLVHVDAELISDHKDPKSGPAEIIEYKLKLRLLNHLQAPIGPLVVRINLHKRDTGNRTHGCRL